MAFVLFWTDWNWEGADAELKKARELDAGSADITKAAADLALAMGRIAEGFELVTLAAAQGALGTAYWEIGQA